MLICTCCERPIVHRPGYVARLGIYQELLPGVVVRTGWADHVICRECMRRIHQAREARIARRHQMVQAF